MSKRTEMLTHRELEALLAKYRFDEPTADALKHTVDVAWGKLQKEMAAAVREGAGMALNDAVNREAKLKQENAELLERVGMANTVYLEHKDQLDKLRMGLRDSELDLEIERRQHAETREQLGYTQREVEQLRAERRH